MGPDVTLLTKGALVKGVDQGYTAARVVCLSYSLQSKALRGKQMSLLSIISFSNGY